MKRIISFFLILLICTGFFSCVSPPPPAPNSQTSSSVWKISRNGNTLFLGGSVHILRETDYPLPDEYEKAFSQSNMLILETDIDQLSDESIVQYLLLKSLLPANQNLRSLLDSDTYELLRAAFAKYGISINGMTQLKPSMVINVLTLLHYQKMGFKQDGVDSYYLEKAKIEKKPVNYLESVETQIDLIFSMGDGYENEFVLYSLHDMENTETEILEILDEWKNGGALVTETSLLEMKDKWPEMYKKMMTDRNSAWMPQITEYLDLGEVAFIIVGLAHLYGPDGLLRQLKNAGCIVENF